MQLFANMFAIAACLDDNVSVLSLELIAVPQGAKELINTALRGTRCSPGEELGLGLFSGINAYALF